MVVLSDHVFGLLSSSVRVRLTFRPFVAWLVSSCRSRFLRPCPIGGALRSGGSRGSCRPGFRRVRVRLPVSSHDRVAGFGRPFRSGWRFLVPSVGLPRFGPGVGPGGADLCDFGFWGSAWLLGRPGRLAADLGLPARSAVPTPVALLSGFLVARLGSHFRPLSGSFPRRLAGGSLWPRFLVPAPVFLALCWLERQPWASSVSVRSVFVRSWRGGWSPSSGRPSYNGTATNITHKRQVRIDSIRSIGEDGNEGRNGRLVQGRDFVITGGDLLAKDGRHGVVMHLRSPSGDRPSVNPRIISETDSRIHCAWPEELSGEEFRGMLCEVVVYKLPPQEDPLTYPRREIKAVIVQA